MRFGMAAIAGVMALASTTSANAACAGRSYAAIPVTMSSEGLTTSGQVNGHPVDFLLDNSAFYSLLPKDMAQSFKLTLKAISTNFSFYTGKGSVNARMGYADSITLGQTMLKGGSFLVLSGENALSTPILGQNILGAQDTEYDLRGGSVRLRRSQGCTDKELVYWATEKDRVGAVSLEAPEGQLDRQIFGKVMVNGLPMRAMFTTHTARTAITAAAVRKLGARIYAQDGQDRVKVGKLDIGGEVRTEVVLDAMAENLFGEVDIIVGLDFFLGHRIYVANGHRKLLFTANAELVETAAR